MQPRYQIFVSSTFRDLREERQAALEAILELGHFPAGMEAFPAADATPLELIRKIIDESDYYIVVVGGKYGSVGPTGISYTEMEFDIAVELKKPILGFVHGTPDEIPVGRSELDAQTRAQLSAFRAKVGERLVKTWRTKEELKAAVLLAIVHAARTRPAFGWVRNEGLENQELLKRLALLQEKYDKIYEENQSLRKLVDPGDETARFADLERSVTLTLNSKGEKRFVEITYGEVFFYVADELLTPTEHGTLQGLISQCLARTLDVAGLVASGESEGVIFQLMAIGLIEPLQVMIEETETRHGSVSAQVQTVVIGKPRQCWMLTPRGRRKFLKKRAVLADDPT